MTKEEYLKQTALAKRKHSLELYGIEKKYALSQTNVWPDDIISDNTKTIKAESFQISKMFTELPYCVWQGVEYTKAGKPRKDGSIGYINSNQIETINGKTS